MKYNAQQIQTILGCKTLNNQLIKSDLRLICFDSRKISFPIKSLFFAFKGPKNDGHDHIEDAYNKGIRNFVISKPVTPLAEANYFMVQDTLEALHRMAELHRNSFSNISFIAITGSYGKTTVKDWLYDLLKGEFAVVKSPKSYNSQIGVALSILQINEHHDFAIIEAGVSERGEMEKLQKLIQPTMGIFTNLGEAHNNGFDSKEEKFIEKNQLFKHCEYIICPEKYKSEIQVLHPKAKLISRTKYSYRYPFSNKISIENASLCVSFLELLNVKQEKIQNSLNQLSSISKRLEIVKGPDKSIIINDAYIADVSSLEIALSMLRQQAELLDKALVISDFDCLPSEEAEVYAQVHRLIKAYDIDAVFHVGDKLNKYINDDLIKSFDNNEALIGYFKTHPFVEKGILIKGARKAKLEELANFLATQWHDTLLEINLSALSHNIKSYSAFLKPETEIIGVIKAGAYGTGSLEIAKLLIQNQIDYLAVAFTDEAIELRKEGIRSPIIILNSQIKAQEAWFDYDLQPIVFSMDQYISIEELCERKKQKLTIHLNLNTGMNRLGLEVEDLKTLKNQLSPYIKIDSILTHLSASEEKRHDKYTNAQIAAFTKETDSFKDSTKLHFKRHVLNSAGIPRFPDFQFDAVRLGLGLYGINTTDLDLDLEKVHTLKSKIIQIKSYSSGAQIGYNGTHVTSQNELIATIPIGYADGLPRKAGNGNYEVLINGQKAKIIANVCMDLIMVNVSHLAEVKVGDAVIIFGQSHPIEVLAQKCGTIPYEILSNLSPRIKRMMVQE